MAISLSELTGASTSGNVLNEVNSYADFLDSVPRLVNKADPSGATDAVQTTATNQPKALPLIDGDGYLYVSGVAGNYASVPDATALDVTGDLTLELDVTVPDITPTISETLLSKYNTTTNSRSYLLALRETGAIQLTVSSDGTFQANNAIISTSSLTSQGIVDGQRITIKATWRQSDGRVQFFYKTNGGSFTQLGIDQTANAGSIYNSNTNVNIGAQNEGAVGRVATAAIHSAKIYASINDTDKRLDVDFTATNVRHGDTKFTCATGQVVTINQDSSSSNDVATIIKKPVLRFDGANSGLSGLFNQTITDGYMFAAFSVLGDGGESGARIFSANSTGAFDYQNGGFTLRRYNLTDQIQVRWNGDSEITHSDVFNGKRGDFLLESPLRAGDQNSKINNADADDGACGLPNPVSSEEFNICTNSQGNVNACLDLEYLALFPATITDAQATQIRNYINKRNNVFYRWDTDGYYFYNPQDLSSGAVTTWNGRIVGSDNGDTDKNATQSTSADQPTSDGYKVTFADNTDHFDIPSTSQAGWQIVGTSLGTFAYKVNGTTAVTELNLLGNAGTTPSRQAGDLYGIILLPESATGREIEQARKLLIDRGAADGVSASITENFFRERDDIVEFKEVSFSGVTSLTAMFFGSGSMTAFNVNSLPDATSISYAFRGTGLTSFNTQLPLVTNANNAFHSSNITSFDVELPKATRLDYGFYNCSSLTSFSTALPLVANAYAAWYGCSSLESFSTELPLATSVGYAWTNCNSLTSFSTALPSVINAYAAWLNCISLSDFSADVFSNWNPSSISSGIFHDTWDGCSSLTSLSVENILVSIDSSGKHGTSDGTSGGTPLADAGIDIDYDGSGLTAATTAAISSLKSKGWDIFINGVQQ